MCKCGTESWNNVYFSRPIAVSHFLERVKELSADADFQYSEEFEVNILKFCTIFADMFIWYKQ